MKVSLACPAWVTRAVNFRLVPNASRPAKVGDELVTTGFKNSITRGFAAIGEPNVAVCLLPGTEVAFADEVKYERTLLPNMKLGKKVARFRQINMGDER